MVASHLLLESERMKLSGQTLEKEPLTQKQGELNLLFKLNPKEATRAKSKKILIKRLTRIERLARQKNYAEIERLLQENYV